MSAYATIKHSFNPSHSIQWGALTVSEMSARAPTERNLWAAIVTSIVDISSEFGLLGDWDDDEDLKPK